jgi:predicted Zn-dependent protease
MKKLDFMDIAETAIEKAVMARNPREIEAGEYTVVLEPPAVAELVSFLGWMGFGAQGYIDGRSSLCGKLGTKIAADSVNISDDVYHPDSTGFCFDFEGSVRQRVDLVVDGVSEALVHSKRTARKMNVEPTGHAFAEPNNWGPMPMNLVMDTGDDSFEDMISSTKDGLLVTHFHYVNVADPTDLVLTGMTRDGLFRIKDGKVIGAVRNMRFTESVFKALKNIVMICDEAQPANEEGSSVIVPAVKIENFRFSSKTDF